MQYLFTFYFILAFILKSSGLLSGQDITTYQGFVSGMLYETIELYPDKTFKWTSEYDLSWDEYGLYEFKSDTLKLKFYLLFDCPKTMSLNDPILTMNETKKTEIFKIEEDKLFRLNKSGRKIHRVKDTSFRKDLSCIFGHKYRIIKIKFTGKQ